MSHLFTHHSTFLFDGGLPKRKHAERTSRYETLLNNYLSNSIGKPSKNITPPFVVLVCQQALIDLSENPDFSLRVVPGEADDYCIEMARKDRKAIIVSADGDFLVHVGEFGQVAPLERFPIDWNGTINFSVYSNLRMEMGIAQPNGLVEVAALLREKPDMSVANCITCVNRRQTLDHIPIEKLREYESVYLTRETFAISEEIGTVLNAGGLTGRVTEMLLGNEQTVWLPLLPVSNPPRKSAWGISRPIRLAAYRELYQKGFMPSHTVTEMDRRGHSIADEIVSIEDGDAMYVGDTREDVFLVAMNTLLDTLSESDIKTLPCFVSMFISLGESETLPAVNTMVPSSVQHICYQYQTLIYSSIVLLQSQNPYSKTIPEFASLWDGPAFQASFSGPLIPEGQTLWEKLTATMRSTVQSLYNPSNRTKQRKKRTSNKVESTSPAIHDGTNRFSILEIH